MQARKRKFDKVKNLGSPIELPGKPLDLLVRDNDLWVAESSAIVQRVDLEVTGAIIVWCSTLLTPHRQDLFSKHTEVIRAQQHHCV